VETHCRNGFGANMGGDKRTHIGYSGVDGDKTDAFLHDLSVSSRVQLHSLRPQPKVLISVSQRCIINT